MSQNYINYKNHLNMFGLVIVTQLRGNLKITLEAKKACMDFCKDLKLELLSGESLVFLTDLWTFSYQYSAEKDYSVTFITETDF